MRSKERAIEDSLITIEMAYTHPEFSRFYRHFQLIAQDNPEYLRKMELTRRRIVRSAQGTQVLDARRISTIARGLSESDDAKIESALDAYKLYCESEYLNTGDEQIDSLAVDRLVAV